MIRKIIKIGNSDGVTIPVSVMRAHKLNAGDRVELRLRTATGDTTDQEVIQAALGILKRYKSDFEKVAKR